MRVPPHSDSLRDDQRLVFRPVAQWTRNAPEDWSVWTGLAHHRVQGRTAELLFPWLRAALDGRRGVAAAAGHLETVCGVRRDVVRACLQHLYDWEILDDAEGYRQGAAANASLAAQERFFAQFSSRPVDQQRALGRTRVALVGSTTGRAACESMLRASGLRVAAQSGAPDDAADLVVTWGLALGSVALEGLNRRCLERRVPLLPVAPHAGGGDLGPLVVPGQSACIACAVDHLGGGASGAREGDGQARAGTRDATGILAALVALEVLRVAAPCLRPALEGCRQRYRIDAYRLERLEFVRRPRCPACGGLSRHSPSAAFQQRGVGHFGS